MDISFNVTGQIITRTDTNVIVGDSKNYHRATFTFSSEWGNINKVAQFSKRLDNFKNGSVYNCPIEGNFCFIPWEVLTDSGSVELSIFGGDLITTRPIVFNVAPSGLKDGQLPAEPTPGYFDQLIEFLKYKFKGDKGDKGYRGDKGDKGDKGIPGEVQLSDLTATNIDYTDMNSNLGNATDVQTALDNAGTQLDAVDTNLNLVQSLGTVANATLQNSWTGTLSYSKNGIGKIVLNFNCTAGTNAKLTIIATLPIGYRPKNLIVFPVVNTFFATTHTLYIHTDGSIKISANEALESTRTYQGEISYYPA